MKILQKIILILHLNVRWIRIMLTVSLVIIIIVVTIPIQHIKTNKIKLLNTEVRDTVKIASHVRDLRILRNKIDSVRLNKTIGNEFYVGDSVKNFESPVPPPEKQLNEPTLKAEKPIDWKGTITWLIGAMNGLVLVVLNVKNLIFKKKD